MKKLSLLPLIFVFFTPLVVNAQDIGDLIIRLYDYARLLVPLLIGIAVVVFFWGVIRYISAAGDSEKIRIGIKYMTYGVIAIFVMVAIWGLVAIVGALLDITPGGGAIDPPQF